MRLYKEYECPKCGRLQNMSEMNLVEKENDCITYVTKVRYLACGNCGEPIIENYKGE